MAKLGLVNPAARGRAERAAVETVAQPGRIETPLAETERRAGGAPATAPAATPEATRRGYRRVFACATGSSDSPDEETNQ
jgi:hypothetical protein